MSRLGGRGQVLTFIKSISLGFSLCSFRDLIYTQTACNTPKRKENLESHHMTPLKLNQMCSAGFLQTSQVSF